jgi:hypothetical protein
LAYLSADSKWDTKSVAYKSLIACKETLVGCTTLTPWWSGAVEARILGCLARLPSFFIEPEEEDELSVDKVT